MMKIYVGHPTGIDFEQELYEPLRDSDLSDRHELVFPHEDPGLFDSRSFLRDKCDLFIAEVSQASTGLGIELGWADMFEVPIVCFYREGSNPSSSLETLDYETVWYSGSGELVERFKEVIERES